MKKFSENQVFTNFLKTHPRLRVDFHSGNAYYNERITEGAQDVSGSTSLYQINTDRAAGNLIFPFVVKDAAKNSFSVTTKKAYRALNPGATINGTYPLTASVTRERPMTTARKKALKNTLNFYKTLSSAYDFSNYESADTNLISIPSIFYGEKIKKGSVTLSCFFSGTLVARAQDTGHNGALIQTFGAANSGSIIGTVLYNEGFLLLTSSAALSTVANDTWQGGSSIAPTWVLYGPYEGTNGPASGSWTLELEGTNTIPVMTMLCEAPKNQFNFSNNPTFLLSGSVRKEDVQSKSYTQPTGSTIKNIVRSDYASGSEPYAPVTYISKIGIYDDNKNLIAIAKLARPVKKDEEDGYTFKVNIDL